MMAKFEFDLVEVKKILLDKVKALHPEYEKVAVYEDALISVYDVNGTDVEEKIDSIMIEFDPGTEDETPER